MDPFDGAPSQNQEQDEVQDQDNNNSFNGSSKNKRTFLSTKSFNKDRPREKAA